MKKTNGFIWTMLLMCLLFIGWIGYKVVQYNNRPVPVPVPVAAPTPSATIISNMCDATIPRESGQKTWDKMTAPPQPFPPVDMGIFDSMTSTTTTDRLRMEYEANVSDYELYTTLTTENAAQLSSNSIITLLALGVAPARYPKSLAPEQSDKSRSVFFFPDGTTMTEAQLVDLADGNRSATSFWSSSQFHERRIKMLLRPDESRNANLLIFSFWDHNTRTKMTNSWSTPSKNDGPVQVHTSGAFWRDSKTDLVLDVAYGDPIVRSLDLKDGATVDFGVAMGRVIRVLEDVEGAGASSSSGARERSMEALLSPKKGKSLLALAISPECWARSLKGSVLYKGEKRPEPLSISRSNALAVLQLRKPSAQVESLELHLQTKVERKVITFDHMPGMPPENAGKINLLDIVVPKVKFTSEYEIKDFLEDMLMLSAIHDITFPASISSYIESPSYSKPGWNFPIELKNPSVRDVLDLYIEPFSSAECTIDATKGSMIIRPIPVPKVTVTLPRASVWDKFMKIFTRKP